MANKRLFKSMVGKLIPGTDARNNEQAPAYKFSDKHALAQYAATGCLNATFYASAETQLDEVLRLSNNVNPRFVAKTAVYARTQGHMKDMPALLCAMISVTDPDLLERIFDRVIDNSKMLQNFVQIMRSGVVGRKSLGSRPKRLIQNWLANRDADQVFRGNIGQNPSMADIIKMTHPKPKNKTFEALYGYLIGKVAAWENLPGLVKHYELFKRGEAHEIPDVPFQMLTSLDLSREDWKEIARHAPWQMTRMNLNTFARHGVFDDKELVNLVARRLCNPKLISKARVFPYQLMAAHSAAAKTLPQKILAALEQAMEIATRNIPAIDGKVYVLPDVSGSMTCIPATGYRKGASSKVRCIDVAALVAASVLRKNPDARVIPFEQRVVQKFLNPRDTVATNAEKLASIGGGGTNCSAPLALLNYENAKGDLVIYVSDNESWVDADARRGTQVMRQWNKFRRRNPEAKLVCIDIQPYQTTQAAEREDILNIGGFSDRVFEIVAEFAAGRLNADHWVGVIENIKV